MSKVLTNHPLEQYANAYDVARSTVKQHLKVAAAVVVASVVIGLLGFAALSTGLLPNHLSTITDITLAAAAGVTAMAVAVVSVLIHYGLTIAAKKRAACLVAFLSALHASTKDRLLNLEEIPEFKRMMKKTLSEKDFKEMLQHLDKNESQLENLPSIYEVLFCAAPARLIKYHEEQKSENATSPLGSFLEQKYRTITKEEFESFLLDVDLKDKKIFGPIIHKIIPKISLKVLAQIDGELSTKLMALLHITGTKSQKS